MVMWQNHFEYRRKIEKGKGKKIVVDHCVDKSLT